MNRILLFTRLLFLSILVCACTANPTTVVSIQGPAPCGESEWPTQGWRTAAPEEQGFDPADWKRVLEEAKNLNIQSLLVVRNGCLIYEGDFAGYDAARRHEMYSVTKSFTATLVGIAVDQGKIAAIDQPVVSAFPQLQVQNSDALKSAMTLTHLLTMTSGLDWQEGDPVYLEMYRSPDWVQYVLDIPMHSQPGSEFRYCSGCSHVLSAAVQQAVGGSILEFADANLFRPLGITQYNWDVDSQGIPIGGWGLQLVPRDMAKLGYLYLRGGVWDGAQIVSSAWIEAATRSHVETGEGWGYGYQWWIDNDHHAYAARGRYGQLIYVAPDLELIVVSTAQADGDEPVLDWIQQVLIPAIQPD